LSTNFIFILFLTKIDRSLSALYRLAEICRLQNVEMIFSLCGLLCSERRSRMHKSHSGPSTWNALHHNIRSVVL